MPSGTEDPGEEAPGAAAATGGQSELVPGQDHLALAKESSYTEAKAGIPEVDSQVSALARQPMHAPPM